MAKQTRINQAMDAAFSPYFALDEFGGQADTSGINWSYAKFPSNEARERFIKACNVNGFRTRSAYEQAGFYLIQYHHYAD